ncbi:MAG: hypothetical protein WAO00_16900 [Chthoniobacterales bacterium]
MEFTRSNDLVTGQTQAVNLPPTGMEGVWFNCDPGTGEISKIVFAIREGVITMRAFGASNPGPIDWGETAAKPYVDRIGSSLITGLTADYDFGFMKTRVAGNVKYGVLVIQSYNEFCDQSGRPPYFTREFFSKEITHRHSALPAGAPCAAQSDQPRQGTAAGKVDLSSFTGHWTNTNPETLSITHFDLFPREGSYYVRASGAGRAKPWGEVELTAHAYDASSARAVAFLARYDLDFAEVTLAGNENKGLLIIASYHRFKDASPRSNYFKREFFYRQEAVQR